ncbi:MAG TPA: TonB-dependent receptor [Vicinamibacterales bacterium]|nr:TonB-dependent receptor [Vicinamibacterales bacterium]
MKAVCVAFLMLVAGLAGRPLLAQPATGSVTGSVSASTGVGLPGATITILNPEAGIERTVVAGNDGEYLVEGLPVTGTYELRADLAGFASVRRTQFTLTPGGRDTVSFLLFPTTAETLSVTARTAIRDQQRSAIQETISDRLTHSLPLIGRDFIALAQLTPGFTGNPNAPSPNGQAYWTNNVIVDGASHYSKWRSAARTFYSGYPLEAIQEVQVMSSQFTPEYGEALASVTSAMTKSGTNERRGTALFFGQLGVLNDQPVFAARKPPASSARFGFTQGGPVARDRTFYFASYEGRRSRSNNFVVSPAAPLAEVPNDEDEHLGFVKVDHRLASNDIVSMRYNGQWFKWHNEPGGLMLPGSGTEYRNTVHTVLVNATQLVSTHILNQARVQVARYDDRRVDLQPSVYVSRIGYSVEGGTLGPYGFGAMPEDTYEGADTLTHSSGRHSTKFGTGFKYVRAHNEALPFGRGAYYFAGGPALNPQPYAFVQGVALSSAAVEADPRSVSSYAFFQDEFRLATQLSVNYGVRYDIEQIRNVANYGPSPDRNNLQPRVSATWTPFGDLSVRGGVGLYTQQHLLYYVNRVQLEGREGAAQLTLTPASPLMPVYPGTVPAAVLSQIPRDVYVVDPDFHNPYSVQAAIGATTRLFGFDVSADYVYLSGRDLMSLVDVNAPAPVIKPAFRTVTQADLTRPAVPVAGGYRKVLALGNEGRSWYRGLQAKANRTVGSLLLLSSYTLSRARDMANYQLPEDSRNLEAEIARSDNDVRHNVTAGLSWQLPSRGAAFGGWTLSATGQFRTSRPYTITWGDDRNGTTQNDARPGARNTGNGDGYRNIDVALARRLVFAARTVELRAEAFNVLSTTNYDEYVGTLSSSFFGQAVSAFPKRRLQFAAVVRF